MARDNFLDSNITCLDAEMQTCGPVCACTAGVGEGILREGA
jgi:hypothetical protein